MFQDLHPIFLLAPPLVCLMILATVLEPGFIVALLIVSRALLDPLLNLTKGDNLFGFGAVLNFFVIFVTFFLSLRQGGVWRMAFFKGWMIFLAVCLASLLYSPVPVAGTKLLFNLASYLCMMILPFLIHPERNDKKFWISLLLISSVFPVLFANVAMVSGIRVRGTFTHPNILAFYLVWVLTLILYVLKSRQFKLSGMAKTTLVFYTLDVLAVLVATGTRNAWIGAWLLFFLYGLLVERKFLMITLIPLAALPLIPGISARLEDLFAYSTRELNSFAWRVEVWKSSLAAVKESWVIGHGLGSFRELSRVFVRLEHGGVDAHNTYLQVLFETGFIGLLAYLSIYRHVIQSLWRLTAEHAIVLSYVVVYLVSGIADNLLYYLAFNWYTWFFLGVILKGMTFNKRIIRIRRRMA
ncbi:MAG: O-antigen ligase family protein [Candidatus Omnitrophica bacterium]|nr:O-antigen ligase family protein [Candidatus Omnitrophota bacterium]